MKRLSPFVAFLRQPLYTNPLRQGQILTLKYNVENGIVGHCYRQLPGKRIVRNLNIKIAPGCRFPKQFHFGDIVRLPLVNIDPAVISIFARPARTIISVRGIFRQQTAVLSGRRIRYAFFPTAILVCSQPCAASHRLHEAKATTISNAPY